MIFYLLFSYASLLAIGGLMGYYKAGSTLSLLFGLLFGGALFALLPRIKRGNLPALKTASFLAFTLFIFFAYRFSLAYALFPAGATSLISLAVFISICRSLYTR